MGNGTGKPRVNQAVNKLRTFMGPDWPNKLPKPDNPALAGYFYDGPSYDVGHVVKPKGKKG